MSSAAQTTVEPLLNRRKNSSLRFRAKCFTKSIVETDASEVSAELTDDIAAERIATIRNPFSQCGTAVSMKMGKMKSLRLIPEPGFASGREMPGCGSGGGGAGLVGVKKPRGQAPREKKEEKQGKDPPRANHEPPPSVANIF